MPNITNPSYLSYPYKYFKYVYPATKNANGTFTLGTKENSGEYVYDNIVNGSTDSETLIGDVTGDQYRAYTPSSKFSNIATFVGGTSDRASFVGRYTGGSANYNGKYYFYTNTKQTAVQKNGETVAAANDVVVCYAAGTLIRTVEGDVAIEHLKIGDHLVTSEGAHRPIRWLGHRLVSCRNHPRPDEAMPIRIAAHAFGADMPARDLLVSPGHSLCVDVLGEVLIPAMALVNGHTISREAVDTVSYWHVELESHDVILAENLGAESYIDMENRTFFVENGLVDLDATPDAPAVTHADFCRPFYAEGALVDAVRTRLSARAMGLCGASSKTLSNDRAETLVAKVA